MASQPVVPHVQSAPTPDRRAVLKVAGFLVGLLLAVAVHQLNNATGIGIGVVVLAAGIVAFGRRGRQYPPRHAKPKA